jgi:hypothetical protein
MFEVNAEWPILGNRVMSVDILVQEGEPVPKVGDSLTALYDPKTKKLYDDFKSMEDRMRADRTGQIVTGTILLFSTLVWMWYYHQKKKK